MVLLKLRILIKPVLEQHLRNKTLIKLVMDLI